MDGNCVLRAAPKRSRSSGRVRGLKARRNRALSLLTLPDGCSGRSTSHAGATGGCCTDTCLCGPTSVHEATPPTVAGRIPSFSTVVRLSVGPARPWGDGSCVLCAAPKRSRGERSGAEVVTHDGPGWSSAGNGFESSARKRRAISGAGCTRRLAGIERVGFECGRSRPLGTAQRCLN